MLPPIRCFTCGKVLGHLWEEFKKERNPLEFFKKYEIERYCCRVTLLTTLDAEEEVLNFQP